MNKGVAIVLAAVIIASGVIAYLQRDEPALDKQPESIKCDQWTTDELCNTVSLDTSTWKTFVNPNYGYAISYPTESDIRTTNDYGDNIDHIYFGISGRFTLGGVDATAYADFPSDLKLYAERVRYLQLSDTYPYTKDKKIGLLTESEVDSKRSYSFTVTKGFDSPNVGYVIPDGITYLYTITENPKGQKIIIYFFKGNPIAEAMLKTFVFK